MKYTYIITLFILMMGLSSCFQKQEVPSDTPTPVTQSGVQDVSHTPENTEETHASGAQSQAVEDNTSHTEEGTASNTGSQNDFEEQQKIIDESVDELESVLTEDIINDIFSDVK